MGMSKQTEALKLALEALESCSAGDYSTGHVIHPSFDVDAVNRAIEAIDALAHAPEVREQPAIPLGAVRGLQWDKTPQAFNNWWDSDYDPTGNPFRQDSAAYWAWAGWKAATEQPAQKQAGLTFYDGNGNVVAHLDATAEIKMDYSKPSAWATPAQQEPDYSICPTCGGMASDPIVPPAQRKPLTDEEIEYIFNESAGYGRDDFRAFARAIEAKLKDKNGY